MSITTLKDTIKAIAQSLQLSTIIPALIFVLLNVLVVFPSIWPDVEWKLSNDTVVMGIIFFTVTLSYILYAFNTPLIRLAEGYIGRERYFMTTLEAHQKERYRHLLECAQPYKKAYDQQKARQELDMYFPSKEDYVLPMSLGNTIAAFEHYPSTRYGMDAVALWPRLIPVLQKNKYIEFVAQQKAVFDFLLNMMYAVLVCGIELILLYSLSNRLGYAALGIFVTFVLVSLLYLGAVNGARMWGLSVRVAFDLYRHDLWNLLHLKPVSKYREEVERWREISRLVKDREEADFFDAFSYEQEESATNQNPGEA